MTRRRWQCVAANLMMVLVVAAMPGCGWRGVNSLPLPGTQGTGSGSFLIQVQMPDVNNIEPNSRVRVADVTVGHVTKIERQGWHALLSMRLNGDVNLPANATAKIGTTSLLGSLHIELAPPTNEPPQGKLHNGSLIPLPQGGAYPSTEQTLAALSMVLNGGGLGQVQDITEAFSTAFRGREQDVRSLITQLGEFTTHLNGQTDDIIAATESLNRLVGKFAAQQPVLDRALATVPDALAVLNSERDNLVAGGRSARQVQRPDRRHGQSDQGQLGEGIEASRTGAGVAGQRRPQPDAIPESACHLPLSERNLRKLSTR